MFPVDGEGIYTRKDPTGKALEKGLAGEKPYFCIVCAGYCRRVEEARMVCSDDRAPFLKALAAIVDLYCA